MSPGILESYETGDREVLIGSKKDVVFPVDSPPAPPDVPFISKSNPNLFVSEPLIPPTLFKSANTKIDTSPVLEISVEAPQMSLCIASSFILNPRPVFSPSSS